MTETTEHPRDDQGRFTEQVTTEHRAVEISDAMSKAVDSDARPADAFTPMKMATPEPPKEANFSDSVEGLRSAADELQKRRQQDQAPVIPRGYIDAGTKERMAPTDTRKLSEAATDLKNMRSRERDMGQEWDRSNLRERIDQYRAEQDAQEALGKFYAKQQQQPDQPVLEGDAVPEPQPEATSEATPANSLAEKYQRLDPELKGAIEQQAMAHENARQQYLQSVQQLGLNHAASLLAEWPELAHSANPKGTLELWRVSQPEKYAAVVGRLNQIQQIHNHWTGLQQQQQAQAAQNFQAYSKGEDSKFDEWEKSRPASEAKHVRNNIVTVLKEDFGIDPQALSQLYNSVPQFRSVEAQKLIYSAVRNVLAERGIQKVPANLPKVMRPGEAYDRPSGESVVVTNKMREFAAAPTAKNAGAALAARRRAAALNRR